MGEQYKHLQQSDRDRIKALYDDGYGIRKIGRTLGIPHSTISRELYRNSYGSDGRTPANKQQAYDSTAAQQKAYARRKYAKYQGKKIEEHDALRSYIVVGLKAGFNPDEISGSMRQTSQSFYASKTAIYEWLYSAYGQPYCHYLPSKQYRPKRRTTCKTGRILIPNRVPITERPKGATNRTRYGHWEGDTVVSGKKTGSHTALAVFVERKTRLVTARLIPNLRPASFAAAAIAVLASKHVLSLSLDNGIENTHHGDITSATGAQTFFCDPYSSWQKGQVEHVNKMLRRYIPKGTDLSILTQDQVDEIVTTINSKPRRCLGYRTALELSEEKGVITDRSGALRG